MIFPCAFFCANFDETSTTHRIYDILKDSGISSSDTTLQILVNTEILADNATVLDLWILRQDYFYNQSKLHHVINPETGEELQGGYIFSEWQKFIARNGQNLYRAIEAMRAEYNPIDNYNMTEQGADGVKQDAHRTTPHGTITNTTTPYQTGINSVGAGAQTGQTTNTTSYQDADSETTYDNTMSIKNNDDVPETGYHHATQHYLKRSGNVGTTQTQTMIENEILLRKHDLIAEFVKRFFDEYCYYVG